MKVPYVIESVEPLEWTAVLRDGDQRSTFRSETTSMLMPGTGPGQLCWRRTCEAELPALTANSHAGQFFIVPVTAKIFALFVRVGDSETPLGLGRVEDLKVTALAYADATQRPIPIVNVPPAPNRRIGWPLDRRFPTPGRKKP